MHGHWPSPEAKAFSMSDCAVEVCNLPDDVCPQAVSPIEPFRAGAKHAGSDDKNHGLAEWPRAAH